jgi:hypothetical protein
MATRRAVAPLLGHELPRLSQFDAFRSSLIVMCSARKSLNSPEKCRWSQRLWPLASFPISDVNTLVGVS